MLPPDAIDQAHHHGRGGGLAAAGFADEAHTLAAVDGEADAIDGAEGGDLGRGRACAVRFAAKQLRQGSDVLARILLQQLVDHEQRFAVGHRRL
jgi:hypothetical protein